MSTTYVMSRIPGPAAGTETIPSSINAAGNVVGRTDGGRAPPRGFLFDGTTSIVIAPAPDASSMAGAQAQAINSAAHPSTVGTLTSLDVLAGQAFRYKNGVLENLHQEHVAGL